MGRTFTHMSKMSSTNANNLMADMISQYPQRAALRNEGATKTLLGTTAKQVLLQTQLIEEAVGLQKDIVQGNASFVEECVNWKETAAYARLQAQLAVTNVTLLEAMCPRLVLTVE